MESIGKGIFILSICQIAKLTKLLSDSAIQLAEISSVQYEEIPQVKISSDELLLRIMPLINLLYELLRRLILELNYTRDSSVLNELNISEHELDDTSIPLSIYVSVLKIYFEVFVEWFVVHRDSLVLINIAVMIVNNLLSEIISTINHFDTINTNLNRARQTLHNDINESLFDQFVSVNVAQTIMRGVKISELIFGIENIANLLFYVYDLAQQISVFSDPFSIMLFHNTMATFYNIVNVLNRMTFEFINTRCTLYIQAYEIDMYPLSITVATLQTHLCIYSRRLDSICRTYNNNLSPRIINSMFNLIHRLRLIYIPIEQLISSIEMARHHQ